MSVQLFGTSNESRINKLENQVRMLIRQVRELKQQTQQTKQTKSKACTVTPDKEDAVECTIT